MISLVYALELAGSHERAIRELYFDLWKRSGTVQSEMGALWQGLARDEAVHATLVQQLLDAVSLGEVEQPLEISLEPLDRTIESVEGFRARLRSGEEIELDEIFRFVVEIELGEQNGVLLQIIQACPTELAARVYEVLKDPVNAHLSDLFAFVHANTGDSDLRTRMAGLL